MSIHEQTPRITTANAQHVATMNAQDSAKSSAVGRRRFRLGVVVGAAVATSTVWLLAHALGANFTLSAASSSITLNLPTVIGFTLWFGGLGWAALALLERYSRKASTIWTRLAVTVLPLSIIPIFVEHATVQTRTALVLIHLTVAAVLIPLMRRTTRAS
jgi:Family of unknown function (DUF6069)